MTVEICPTPKLIINSNHKIITGKIYANSDPVYLLMWNKVNSNGKVIIDIENSLDCINNGLHYVLWGYYGSPDKELLQISDSTGKKFVEIYPEKSNSIDGYEGQPIPGKDFLTDQFAIVDSTLLRWTSTENPSRKFNANPSIKGSGSVFVYSFFETNKNLILYNQFDGNNEPIEDEGMLLVDHRYYPDYEIFDLDVKGQGLDYKYCIDGSSNSIDKPIEFTIKASDKFKYFDIFISINDIETYNGSTEEEVDIYLNGSKMGNVPTSTMEDEYYYDVDHNPMTSVGVFKDLDATIDNDFKIVLSKGWCIGLQKVRVIYHN
jgi:hypothetical protein